MPISIRSRHLAAALLSAVASLTCASQARADVTPRLFAADSIWNAPLRADVPLDTAHATSLSWLTQQVSSHGTWLNRSSCNMPIYWAPAGTPAVPVRLDHPSYVDKALVQAWSAVPIPVEAQPAPCSDRNFAVAQRQADGTVTLWEMWSATRSSSGAWTAKWGGVTLDAERDRGIASPIAWQGTDAASAPLASSRYWNVTATSISMAAGVVTTADLQQGHIDHALALATPTAAAGRWSWPAQRTDGTSADPAALAEGARLRMDPRVDLSQLKLTPIARMLAQAAQRYGVVVRDQTFDRTVFYFDQPPASGPDPFSAALGGSSVGAALANFPWSDMQLLAAPSCSTAVPCTASAARVDVDGSPTVGQRVTLDMSSSLLEQPRQQVVWDLDGDGTFETVSGASQSIEWTPTTSGTRSVGVRIEMRGGQVVEARRTLEVQAAPSAPRGATSTAGPAATRELAPVGAAGSGFYSYSGGTLLTSVSTRAVPPATPSSTRRAYSASSTGRVVVTLGGGVAAGSRAPSVQARAWVTCSIARCLDLELLDGSGAVIGRATGRFGASSWVTVDVPRVGPSASLSLRAVVRSQAGAGTSTASIGAVSATVTG